jgi:Tol biopolymer transport system component
VAKLPFFGVPAIPWPFSRTKAASGGDPGPAPARTLPEGDRRVRRRRAARTGQAAKRATLAAGARLGPYEIVSLLGAGGMGEVYRARDTRLDRIVAVKILPAHLSASEKLRQRFEREARVVSALSHPHICVLHDIGHADGVDYLVMEYLEGETLADRLRRGALPVEQVLRYGIEIAQALDGAHRHRIVHRDLKPTNVMLTKSGTKLLDFGLAKLREAAHGPGTPTIGSRTTQKEHEPLTEEGTLVGTLQYMAPEQLDGKEPDARTDIFALGATLYEMATGRRAFTGTSEASLIAAILASEPPPISRLKPLTPPALDRVVTTCLAKDPEDRWQSAHDLARELKWIADTGVRASAPAPTADAGGRRAMLGWSGAVVACTLGAVALGLAVRQVRQQTGAPVQVHLEIRPPERTTFSRWPMVFSPDGERLAFVATANDGVSALYLRRLNSPVATRIPDTERVAAPFWSPDGRQIGFVSRGKLARADLSTGSVHTIAELGGSFMGASWSRDGIIAFSDSGELFRVPASGGERQPLAKRAAGETARYWPEFLPDGRHYLYVSQAAKPEETGIYAASLDSDERKRIVSSDRNVTYSPSGHLLFIRDETLLAQRFDIGRLEITGEAFPVADHVAVVGDLPPSAAFAVSANGVLAWRGRSALPRSQLTWFDRSGKQLGTVGEAGNYANPALSPDERRLAVGRRESPGKSADLWVFDLLRGTATRLTDDPADDMNPTWSPDGKRIAFWSSRRGVREIYQKAADGSGHDALVLESKDWSTHVEDWSPDGRFLLYNYWRAGKPDLYIVPLSPAGRLQPIPFVATSYSEHRGQFSPDGRWVTYGSTESGQEEVYVRGVSPGGTSTLGKWQVSTAGGLEPRWRHDGRELFYVSSSTLMAVPVKTDGTSFEAGIPTPLFEIPLLSPVKNRFVVSRDGQRFLVNVRLEQATTIDSIQVLVNWLPSGR